MVLCDCSEWLALSIAWARITQNEKKRAVAFGSEGPKTGGTNICILSPDDI